MTYAKAPHRLGTTAIAAVMALTATPMFAQSMETAPADTPAPVVLAPPPVVAPAPAAQTAMPQSGSSSVVTAPVIAGSGPGTNLAQTPRVDLSDTPDAAPVTAKSAVSATPRAARIVAARAHTAETVAAPTPAAVPAPVAKMPPAVATVDQPAAPAPQPAASPALGGDTLPVAGIAGIGALALIGGALAVRRRRRDDEDVVYETTDLVPEPIVAAPIATAPVYARDLRDMPAQNAAEAPATTLPSGFDISRFGPHVQAAYRGPTEDNPSLSLKTRLKRASFFDQRERMAASPPDVRTEAPAVTTTMDRAQPVAPRRPEVAPSRPARQPNFRPAFQR